MQHELLSGVLSMMEKVAVSKLMASHTQIRKGRRPYRVSTLLEKDKPMHDVPELLKDVPEKIAGVEEQKRIALLAREAMKGGTSFKDVFKKIQSGGKKALSNLAPKETALQAFESAGKVVTSSVRLAGFFDELDKIAGPQFEAALQASGGSMTGLEHAIGHGEWLKQQAAKKDLGTIVKRYGRVGGSAAKPTGGFLSRLMRKAAGVGVDLRLLKKSGVTNISMPTEESLAQAKSKLERTQRVGADLKVKPPEPNIRAVATKTK